MARQPDFRPRWLGRSLVETRTASPRRDFAVVLSLCGPPGPLVVPGAVHSASGPANARSRNFSFILRAAGKRKLCPPATPTGGLSKPPMSRAVGVGDRSVFAVADLPTWMQVRPRPASSSVPAVDPDPAAVADMPVRNRAPVFAADSAGEPRGGNRADGHRRHLHSASTRTDPAVATAGGDARPVCRYSGR